jgi:hypothetical protein
MRAGIAQGSPGTRMARYCDTNPMTTIIAKLVARAIAHEPRVGNISSAQERCFPLYLGGTHDTNDYELSKTLAGLAARPP